MSLTTDEYPRQHSCKIAYFITCIIKINSAIKCGSYIEQVSNV